jgi:hypothetical protein
MHSEARISASLLEPRNLTWSLSHHNRQAKDHLNRERRKIKALALLPLETTALLYWTGTSCLADVPNPHHDRQICQRA